MRKIASVLSAAVLTLTLCACSSGSSTSSITVAGSTTCLPIAEIAAEGFKEETGTDVLVSGLGSSAGIEAVSAGTADIASSSRGLNADEQDLGLTPIVIAHDGIAVIVNDDNPVDNLSTEQLRDIYAGKITNWKEVGGEDLKIQVINRDEASGTREAFRTIVMDGTPFDRRSAVLSARARCAMSCLARVAPLATSRWVLSRASTPRPRSRPFRSTMSRHPRRRSQVAAIPSRVTFTSL